MIRKFAIAAFVLALATQAQAQAVSRVGVIGWAKPPARVEVFNAEGVQQGVRSFEGVPVSGRYAWNQDYDLVEVQKGVWVGREALLLDACGKSEPAPSGMPGVTGGQGPSASTGFGSGKSCQPGVAR